MPAPVSSLIGSIRAVRHDRAPSGWDVPVRVWEVLSTIPDPRRARGRRHDLATVLAVSIAAVAAGACSVLAIAEWAAALPSWARPRFGIGRRPPGVSTIRRGLGRPGCRRVGRGGARLAGALDPPPAVPAAFRAVAVDGKTCRGARQLDGSRIHLFSIVEHASAILVGQQVNAGGKDHEIAAFAAVLDRIDLKNVVVTADALHTQDAHARYLHRHGGHFVFSVKRNRPRLYDQLARLPWAKVPIGDRTEDKGHGRRETRTLQLADIAAGISFPHARRAGRIVRTRTVAATGKTTREIIYVVTSLTWGQATPAHLADLVRGHWALGCLNPSGVGVQ